MKLSLYDLHLIFSGPAERLKVFNGLGTLVLDVEARNRTVNPGTEHWGHLPPGEYLLGAPVKKNTVPFGRFFIPLTDALGSHASRDHGRAGLGIHGGGTGLADPFAPQQGWQITEGCLRVQNEILERLVQLLDVCHSKGGKAYLTAEGLDR